MTADSRLHVMVGEYLGRLPFQEPGGSDPRTRATQLQGGRLLDLPDHLEPALDFLRRPREASEYAEWAASRGKAAEGLLNELVSRGTVVTLSVPGTLSDVSEYRLLPRGASLGVGGETNDYHAFSPDEEVIKLAPATYWFWIYSRAGKSVPEVIEFVERDVFKAQPGSLRDDITNAITFLLATGLAALDRKV